MKASDTVVKSKAKSYSGKEPTVAEYLTAQIDLCGKTQLQIAREAGFPIPNVITMMKQGKTKLPKARIGALAKSLGVDALFLYKLVMKEYEPETWSAIEEQVLTQPFITQNEFEIIEVIRAGKVINPKVRTDEDRRAILDAVATLKPENATND